MTRGLCRVCLRRSAVTRRGNVWHHRARTWGQAGPRCGGAGLPPLGVPLDGPEPLPVEGQGIARSPLTREHGVDGTIYLLHFDRPFGHAAHYLGWASPGNLSFRLAHHGGPSGANLMRHVAEAGIGWTLARTWAGDRHRERRLKVRGGHTRKCPLCCPERGARLLVAAARSIG